MKIVWRFIFIFFLCPLFIVSGITGKVCAGSARPQTEQQKSPKELRAKAGYTEYIDFFDKVYETMKNNYYVVVNKEDYERFLNVFDKEIYAKLRKTGKSNDYIRWRSAAYLIDFLKTEEDTFSAFFPPKPAKKFEQKVLGKKIDLGLEGQLTPEGYILVQVEPRSDAYAKGLRIRDIIKKIQGKDILSLSEEEIQNLLRPLEGTLTTVVYLSMLDQKEYQVDVETKEYFKQTIFMRPTHVPNIFLLEFQKFNRKTSEDMLNYLRYIDQNSENPKLIIDMRGNPGGPPLAAREISSFFLTPYQEFAYFQKKGEPKSKLFVPKIPTRFHFKGPIVILVNEMSGSASELFSGAMQYRGRAVIMGKNTAGKVFLKSMFPFEDESMVLLVTGRGYYPDGRPYSFEGVKPDDYVDSESTDDLIQHAIKYLLHSQK